MLGIWRLSWVLQCHCASQAGGWLAGVVFYNMCIFKTGCCSEHHGRPAHCADTERALDLPCGAWQPMPAHKSAYHCVARRQRSNHACKYLLPAIAIVVKVASCLRIASAFAGARCSAADALLDDWFLAEPRPADVKQMQTLVEHILAHQQQMQLDRSIK